MKTRFCPSPTGHLHVGNMRTALFNYLYSLKEKGGFLLRIEDTDLSRSKVEFTISMESDLQWLSLNWDEGVTIGGKNGPYEQSKRIDIYDKYYHQLIEQKQAYHCFCTEEELTKSRKIQAASARAPKYSGKCRNLSEDEVAAKFSSGQSASLRFSIPSDQVVTFTDQLRGVQEFKTNDLGDFIIRKPDGMASFMFANAIDDASMQVSHVFRGDDHLTNTPRQLLILQALNLDSASYCHMSTILGKDKLPLSKRNGSQRILDLKNAGYLPKALNNYLARLGHTYESNELMELSELADKFSVAKLVKSPAIFDIEQLDMWQKLAVSDASLSDFKSVFCKDFELNGRDEAANELFFKVMQNNVLFPHEMKEWSKILFEEQVSYSEESLSILKEVPTKFYSLWQASLSKGELDIKALYKVINQEFNIKGKAIYQPLRLTLTNRLDGPELHNIANIMGVDIISNRINKLLNLIAKK